MTTLPLWPEEPSEGGPVRLTHWPTPKAMLGDHPGQSKVKPGQELHLTIAVNSGGYELESSPLATHASHSHSPGSDWARKMTAISGRTLLRSLTTSGPLGACLRTLLDTSLWGSTACYLTWKRSATPAGRLLYRLVPSAPRTGATGFGLWPTPVSTDRPHEGNVRIIRQKWLDGEITEQEATDMLRGQHPAEAQGKIPALWPTPNVAGGGNMCELTPHKGHFLRPSGEKAHLGLDQAVRLWPTVQARDWKGPSGRSLKGTEMDLPSVIPGKLNPDWVSRLMGYPDGWLDLGTEDGKTACPE